MNRRSIGLPLRQPPSSSRSRLSTRDFATRTAPGLIPSSAATSAGERASTAVSQKACQVRASNSPRMRSTAARSRPTSSCSALESSPSGGRISGKLASRIWASVPPSPPGSRPELAKMVAHLVVGDAVQPAAKRVAGFSLAEAGDVRGEGAEDVLEDVGGLVLGQVPAPEPAIDERTIQPDESLPRRLVVGLDAVRASCARSRSMTAGLRGSSWSRRLGSWWETRPEPSVVKRSSINDNEYRSPRRVWRASVALVSCRNEQAEAPRRSCHGR